MVYFNLYEVVLHKDIKNTVSLLNGIQSFSIPSIPEYDFNVFDFVIENKPLPLKKRKDNLVNMQLRFLKHGINEVKIIPFQEINNKNLLLKACNNAIRLGDKGLILKDPTSPYIYDRDSRWLSYENPRFERGEIIEILRDKNFDDKCSCIIVRNRKGIEKMVTDISKQLKVNLWKNKNDIIGLNCMIEKGNGENRLQKIYYYKGLNL